MPCSLLYETQVKRLSCTHIAPVPQEHIQDQIAGSCLVCSRLTLRVLAYAILLCLTSCFVSLLTLILRCVAHDGVRKEKANQRRRPLLENPEEINGDRKSVV